MSKIRDMIDLIADENFDGAKSALKATLAEYMAGRKFLSNRDLYGKDYTNPNEEEQSIKAGLAESDNFDSVAFEKNMDRIKRNRFQPRHFLDDVEDDNVDTWDKLIAHPKYGQDFIADLDQLDFRAAAELSAELSESTEKDVGDMADELIDAYDNPKKAQYIWEELEKETDDSGIYVADATPDDLIEYLVKAKPDAIKRLYDKFVKE